jgi:hypothetical protein
LYRRVLVAAGLALAALAGCGPLNPGTIIATNGGNFNLRVLQGSPDVDTASTIDARLDSATGALLGTSIGYGKMTAYSPIGSGAHSLVVEAAGGTTPIMTCSLGALTPGANYTVVVAGKFAAGVQTATTSLQCQVFAEPIYPTVTSPSANIAFHHAAPSAVTAGGTVLSIGTYPQNAPTTYTGWGTAQFANPVSGVAFTTASYVTINGSATAPGIGFYTAPSNGTTAPPTTVWSTLSPSQVNSAGVSGLTGTADTGNLFPTSGIMNFSLYAIDAQTGSTPVTLVGVFD